MRRALPYVLFAVTLILCVAVLGMMLGRRELVFAAPAGAAFPLIIFALVFSGVGLLVARARPGNAIGWIYRYAGVGSAFSPLSDG